MVNRKYEENGVTTRLSRFVVNTKHENIPAEVREYVKVLITDTLACGFSANLIEAGQIFAKAAEETFGNKAEAVIVTSGAKVPAAGAAYANAALFELMDADDTFYTSCHPMASIAATSIAIGESIGASGKELVTAIAVGYDVAVRVKRSLKPAATTHAWFAMGCAAAAAKLYGLNELETAMNFGCVGFGAPHQGGRWSDNGSGRRHYNKYWNNQHTALAAVSSAISIKNGWTADRTIFDGKRTYAHFLGYESINEDSMFEDLGKRWFVDETAIKPWAICKFSQISITFIKEIMEENNLKPEDIEDVEIQTWKFIASPWFSSVIEITSPLDAQFSFPHAIAATILGWDLGPEWQLAAIDSKELVEVAKTIKVIENPNYDRDSIITEEGNRSLATVVTLRAKGQEYIKEGGTALGDPFEEKYKMTMEKIKDKFYRFSKYALTQEQMDRIYNTLLDLENIDNIQFKLTC